MSKVKCGLRHSPATNSPVIAAFYLRCHEPHHSTIPIQEQEEKNRIGNICYTERVGKTTLVCRKVRASLLIKRSLKVLTLMYDYIQESLFFKLSYPFFEIP